MAIEYNIKKYGKTLAIAKKLLANMDYEHSYITSSIIINRLKELGANVKTLQSNNGFVVFKFETKE